MVGCRRPNHGAAQRHRPTHEAGARDSQRLPAPTAKHPATASRAAADRKPQAATGCRGSTDAPDYVIGPGDILAIVFWREQDMSAEVVVRPDGRISIPLLNEVEGEGTDARTAAREAHDGSTEVRPGPERNGRRQSRSTAVACTSRGRSAKPGPYPLTTSMTVLQLISTAGGLLEYADEKNITIMRNENGKIDNYTFNYKDILNRKNLKQNIELKPDDTIIVP